MTIAFFLHVDGPAGQQEPLQNWADEVFAPALGDTGLPHRIEAYNPESVKDPYLNCETGKLLIVEANFKAPDELTFSMGSARVRQALAGMPTGRNFRTTAEAFTVRHFPLIDGSSPPRRARLSFVVRYYPPIEQPEAFINHYFDHHPPIMTHFPGIRNILCYIPIDWHDPNQITPLGSFLGNEIVFDSIEDLNTALASDIRHDLRADYYQFPPHEGVNSHHAMHRRTLFEKN